ncbi:MAG: DUF362 domain-containing protein [Eubacteriales bacterium]|nr:DUF362 domain-containing protein [Eubacteriales bacterium]
MKEYVVITKAPKMDFRRDYVSLPKNYGTQQYYQRQDIKAIYKMVYDNLDQLNEKNNFVSKLRTYEKILVKPNLVSVYHNSGMEESDYPESTDPRVFEAVISYIKQYHDKIVIVESSGKPMPTRTSFKVAGYDRIARHHNVGLVALETCPVVRYMLPKAEVMKEVYIPQIFKEAVEGRAFYISVPKLKTNLYTQVTLGFKNAMGAIPYAMRERNHNYYINKKLADLLYLIKPDLIFIDGLIGGEGNTPAPVDPVDSHVVISGTNAVAVDSVGTRIMGLDPEQVPLMNEAVKRGFDAEETEIVGEMPRYHFRRANPSLMDEEFKNTFPNILVLAGHNLPHAPKVEDPYQVTPEMARELEMACDGGCLAALRSGFDYVIYAPKKDYTVPLVIIIGGGVKCGKERYWFDRKGKPYTESEIRNMELPLMTVGNCAKILDSAAKYKTPGCCSPSVCMLAATAAMKIPFPLLSVKNKAVVHFGIHVLSMALHRAALSLMGKWVDCPSLHQDKIYPIPKLPAEKNREDYIEWPLPKMDFHTRRKMAGDQLRILKL